MSIKVYGKNINRIYSGNQSINKVYRGNLRVFPDAIGRYIEICKTLGGNEIAIRSSYNNIPQDLRSNANYLLFPSVTTAGKIYAMDNTTGDPITLDFSRPSTATLFNTDLKMELVGNDIARIDYGNYGKEAKILIEKESTNLVSDNTNIAGGRQMPTNTSIIDFDWQGTVLSPKSALLDTSFGIGSPYLYNSVPMTKGQPYIFSIFACDASDYPVLQTDNYTGSAIHGGFSSINVTNTISGNSPNVQYRANIGRYYASKLSTITSSNQINGIAKATNTLHSQLNVGGCQVERGSTMTSYIPTAGTSMTRLADCLSIALTQASIIHLKTTRKEVTFEKPAGLWNVHEDLDNEGILYLAIKYK